MPKEKIDSDIPYQPRVAWGRDGSSVQLGLEDYAQHSLLWNLYGGEALEKYAPALIDYCRNVKFHDNLTTEDAVVIAMSFLNIIEGNSDVYYGLWSNLNRDDINQLIRVLRRARDQAFGRDE